MPWRHLRGRRDDRADQPNPFETFLFVVMLLSAVPLLAGNTGSAVLEKQLPDIAVILWGICLLLGAILVLTAVYWPTLWISLVVERAGMILVGAAALVYAGAIVTATWEDLSSVRYIVSLHLGITAAATVRALQITRRMRWLITHKPKLRQ